MPLPWSRAGPRASRPGVALTKRTVYVSTISTRSSAGQKRRATGGTSAGSCLVRAVVTMMPLSGSVLPCTVGRVSPNMRCGAKLKATSSAVNSSPLWNLHAAAQVEFDRPVVDAAPGGGQARLRLELALVVEVDQPLDEERRRAGCRRWIARAGRPACCCW